MNKIILKGVKFGKNSIIGAGSIVIKNIIESVIATGNHCVVKKSLIYREIIGTVNGS